ncbi:MAG TPA: hypothetical protein G4O07_03995 [Dehalococcoidia bacterium]|nr:hypothetical protein [Dehalococcoidia bacterium]
MNNTVTDVLIWLGLAFAAGFVGYFGRHLAVRLIDRFRRKKPEQPAAIPPQSETSASADPAVEAQAKIEKKKAKAEAKRVKKAGDQGV